jgi:CDP-diacylglycerol--glycerol-3-phosphate 3-phosphatidyltransferase
LSGRFRVEWSAQTVTTERETDHSTEWARLHHGIDPARVPLQLPWLRTMWWLARPLAAARVPPTAVTIAGLVLGVDAALLAVRHPWAAGVTVVLAALCDGLDGAVAVVGSRATRHGAAADAIADRIGDAAFAVVLWRCGAPWWLALACGAVALGIDGLRRLRNMPARITVGERPTWTICAALACGSSAIASAQWPVLVCAAVWLAAGITGLAQLLGRRG